MKFIIIATIDKIICKEIFVSLFLNLLINEIINADIDKPNAIKKKIAKTMRL